MKLIKYCIGIFAFLALNACKDKENELLETKVYFEQAQQRLKLENNVSSHAFNITARVSNISDSDVNVTYQIGDAQMVADYNAKNGTKYQMMPAENFSLQKNSTVIKKGSVYAEPCQLALKNLSTIQEGNTYVIPVTIADASVPTIEAKTLFVEVAKPIVINKVFDFNGRKYLSIPMDEKAKFNALTYEAMIYVDTFKKLSTVMGAEGNLIFRFGDTTVDADQIQVAGNVQFNPSKKFAAKQWYHVALVFDGATKRTEIYVDGERVAEKTASVNSFNLNGNFFIGYAYDYDGSRTWRGKMSECRVWSVARTANELKNNKLGVDPNSEGLFGYWKLNGTDVYQKDGNYYVKDQSKNHRDATSRRGAYQSGRGLSVEPDVVEMRISE